MHPDPRLQWTDREAMREFIRRQSFGAVFLTTPEGPRVAHVPLILLGEARIGFHLSRRNALADHMDGARALFVVQGPHAYVSPDWYGIPDQVPTWNYVAVELEGVARRTDGAALLAELGQLSAEQEAWLAPKAPWSLGELSAGIAEKMAGGVVGFEMDVEAWRGTAKLGQNKPDAVRLAAADGLEASGAHEVAALMREARAS
ncbi:MAG: FMN-binding negative transcriptional regulator [Sphingobium sp.]|nr:FMN-binding negative transcriptional regulator [Sphingobium sp.]